MNHTGLASVAFLLSTAIAGFTVGPTHELLHVLAPITHGNLTIFPVVGGIDYDTSRFLTLDEGVRAGTVIVTEQGAVQGLLRRSGSREVVETEAGIYRRAEITGDNYKVFSITALLPKTDFDVHIAKMTYDAETALPFRPAIMVR